MSVAASLAAKVSAMVANAGGDAPAPTTAPEPNEAAPPVTAGSEAVLDAGDPPAADDGAAETKTRHQLLEEKLARAREIRAADRLKAKAREESRQAEADRKAAAEERAKYDGLKNGSYLETIKSLGRDPKVALQEMVDEARRAGTPEAQIEVMREQFKKELSDTVEPLKKTIEELTAERERRDAREKAQAFQHDFRADVADEAFAELRVEYGDQKLFRIVEGMRKNPDQLRAHAKELGVRLTYGDGRFNMRDILTVLSAAHVAHETEKKQRRDQMQAPTTSPGAPPQAPATAKTVNGTAERRNAESNPLGNDTAASNASAQAPKSRLSKQGRIERAIARDVSRRG